MNEKEVTPEILKTLQKMELFAGKDPDELTEWLGPAELEGGAECELHEFKPGDFIITQGSFGNSFYIIITGAVTVSLEKDDGSFVTLATLGPGNFVGEMTLISGLPRNANVIAKEKCRTIKAPRRVFEASMKKPGPFRNAMNQVYVERGLANHLRMIPYFSEIDPAVLSELIPKVKLKILNKDDAVFLEGDDADSFYLIRDGYVRVVKRLTGGEERIVAYLKDGYYFGESALIHAEKRNASIFAMGKVELLQIMREDFLALLNRYESLADKFQAVERARLAAEGKKEKSASPLGFIGEVVERGLVKATSALVINLNRCTRCGNCVNACAELHEGISRLTRHGMKFEVPVRNRPEELEKILVTTSCMHCKDPECMIGCPTGAITRDVNGEVFIEDSCIGCGNCARRCPYGNISLAEANFREESEKQRTAAPMIGSFLRLWKTPEDEPMMHEVEATNQKAVVKRLAVKCDLCKDWNYNHGCVHNCPYSAIERIDPQHYFEEFKIIQ